MINFSIITISLNARDALKRTIDSINLQTYNSIEHVIVDGGSEDGSTAIIQNNAQRNVKWVSERDNGIADAFNKGTILATGDYVCYLNAGDVFADPCVLANVADAMVLGAQDLPVFYGHFYSVRNNVYTFHEASARLEDFSWNNPINHQSAFVPTALARRYPYDRRLRLAMDYDFWLRVRQETRFQKLEFAVAVFASDGRSSDPTWSVHNLMVRRALWHVNLNSRVEFQDVVNLVWKAAKLRLRFIGRRLLGEYLMQIIRRRKAPLGGRTPVGLQDRQLHELSRYIISNKSESRHQSTAANDGIKFGK
jgi:glycosyltransferase involved in cell wall biosynthesis